MWVHQCAESFSQSPVYTGMKAIRARVSKTPQLMRFAVRHTHIHTAIHTDVHAHLFNFAPFIAYTYYPPSTLIRSRSLETKRINKSVMQLQCNLHNRIFLSWRIIESYLCKINAYIYTRDVAIFIFAIIIFRFH